MITDRIRDETRSGIQYLIGALPGAEKALAAGARQTIKDAIDLHLTPPKLPISKSLVDTSSSWTLLHFGR